jgi:hypothetical protein
MSLPSRAPDCLIINNVSNLQYTLLGQFFGVAQELGTEYFTVGNFQCNPVKSVPEVTYKYAVFSLLATVQDTLEEISLVVNTNNNL